MKIRVWCCLLSDGCGSAVCRYFRTKAEADKCWQDDHDEFDESLSDAIGSKVFDTDDFDVVQAEDKT